MTELEKAARQALEALESCEMSNYGRDWVWPATAHETAMKNVKEAITALREALAEQPAQQEPVCDKDPRGCWSVRCQIGKVCKNKSPQPSKPWVGLTEEERLALAMHENFGSVADYAEAIEAKLREKNA